MYKRLSIEHFRGIKQANLDDLGQINLFVGTNNSGKTSVLEAIFLLTGMGNPENLIKIDAFRTLFHNEGDDFRFIFFNLDYSLNPKLIAEMDDTSERGLIIFPKLSSSISAINKSNITPIGTKEDLKADGLFSEFYLKSKHSQRQQFKSTITFQNGRNDIELSKNYKETIQGVFLSTKQDSHDLVNYKAVEEIIRKKKKIELIEVLKILDSEIVGIELFSNNMIFFDKGLAQLVPSNLSGEGIKKLFGIIISIINSPNGIVLIDEIENGFYYKTLKKVWKSIVVAAKKYNVQLFITTHNYEILHELDSALNDDEMVGEKSKIRTYKLVKQDDKTVKAIKYDFEQLNTAIENNNEIR